LNHLNTFRQKKQYFLEEKQIYLFTLAPAEKEWYNTAKYV